MLDISSSVSVGDIDVFTTDNKGHSIEEVAQMAANRILYISEEAPSPIRDQAQAFKNTLQQTLVYYMRQAVEQDRATICAKLRKNGLSDLANNLRNL
jgi:hypothetical protein|tara:strand:- start:472 stop:762 length:291 start_codon:yes stop_codon:yes gene_type:complete